MTFVLVFLAGLLLGGGVVYVVSRRVMAPSFTVSLPPPDLTTTGVPMVFTDGGGSPSEFVVRHNDTVLYAGDDLFKAKSVRHKAHHEGVPATLWVNGVNRG